MIKLTRRMESGMQEVEMKYLSRECVNKSTYACMHPTYALVIAICEGGYMSV